MFHSIDSPLYHLFISASSNFAINFRAQTGEKLSNRRIGVNSNEKAANGTTSKETILGTSSNPGESIAVSTGIAKLFYKPNTFRRKLFFRSRERDVHSPLFGKNPTALVDPRGRNRHFRSCIYSCWNSPADISLVSREITARRFEQLHLSGPIVIQSVL